MSDQQIDQIEGWRANIDGDSVHACIDALRQISSLESVQGLTVSVVRLAGSEDDEIRMWASEALESAIQPNSSELLMLIQLLESTNDSEICYWAATMLGRLGRNAGASAGALEACVRESMYLPARERATWALTQIGPAAQVAIPTLQEASETAPPRLQRMAQAALERIDAAKRKQQGTEDASEEAA